MGETAVLARRWFDEVWNDRREATIDEFVMDDSVCHADQGELRGAECFRLQQYRPFIGAFPNLRVNVDDVMESGSQAVVRWSARGTHLGHDLGFAPTGRVVEMKGITWMRFDNGRLMEGWQSSNLPEVIRSLKE